MTDPRQDSGDIEPLELVRCPVPGCGNHEWEVAQDDAWHHCTGFPANHDPLPIESFFVEVPV